MATPSQIAANKTNSQKSTGPRTDAGKAKSSLNHMSHGFAASTSKLIAGENPEDLKALLADLTSEYQPATPTEQILVEKMAQNQWISLRAFRLQSSAFGGKWGMSNLPASPDLGVLIRYRTSAENAFHKAHNELVKTQKERQKSEIGFEPQNAGQTADPPPDQPKTGPKTASLACVHTDFPAEPATSATEITPEAPKILKKAA
jgi:hypothetical protein